MKKSSTIRAWLWSLGLMGTLPAGGAPLAVCPLVGDHAVLQRDRPVPIWGWAIPGEEIHLRFHGHDSTARADAEGRWQVTLAPLAADGVGADLQVQGAGELVLHDVVVGDVWLCSGQSNMTFRVNRANNAAAEIAAANYPLIRQVEIRTTAAAEPAERVGTTGWRQASPATAGSFTAVGYFFARTLFDRVGVPIGIVDSAWGGTPVESWMAAGTLPGDPGIAAAEEQWTRNQARYPANKAAYDALLAGWKSSRPPASAGPDALSQYLQQHPQPVEPPSIRPSWQPHSLFNGMIHPLIPGALRGILWYQGESNAGHPGDYHRLFAAMIQDWRTRFGPGEIPFYWVQLANFKAGNGAGVNWAQLREAQNQTLSLPQTGQAVTIDIGNPDNVHPTNKQEVGRRLASIAEAEVYHLPVQFEGPTFAGATAVGSAMQITFLHADGGLAATGSGPQGLQLAGADRVFHPAEGRIDGDSLVVTAAGVDRPIAVRYAWTNAPSANLYNRAGLPAVPFRSDNW